MKQTLTQRVKKIEKEIRQMRVVLDSHGTDLYHIRNSDPEPYTAMRSTGERIADEQENREKQMKEDIRVVLDEFWMNGKEAGYLMKYDNVITTDTVINKILAIVKGE